MDSGATRAPTSAAIPPTPRRLRLTRPEADGAGASFFQAGQEEDNPSTRVAIGCAPLRQAMRGTASAETPIWCSAPPA